MCMSKRTYNEGGKKFVKFSETDKTDLEVVLTFDKFPQEKTKQNIASWLEVGHHRAGLKPEYLLCHSTDGASNAVGSALEFQQRIRDRRSTDIEHYTCMAHQVNRSAKFSSGTGDFAYNANEKLSSVIRKMHEINGRVFRNEGRLKVLYQVQKEKNRYVGH